MELSANSIQGEHAMMAEDYLKIVEEMKTTKGLERSKYSPIWERLWVTKLPLDKLHPNPDDEFSDPSIGPNYGIVNEYKNDFIDGMADIRLSTLDPLATRKYSTKEPLIVEKLSTGGYRILNGHHRWLAAKRAGVSSLPVKLINTVSEEKIIADVEKSKNDKCVAFDLDEVLICDNTGYLADKPPFFPFNKICAESVRLNAGALMTELQNSGFDVWVYTGNFVSTEHIKLLLRLHKARRIGVINSIRKGKDKRLRYSFENKYKIRINVENDGFMLIRHEQKDVSTYEVSSGKEWAAKMLEKIKEAVS